MQMNEADIEYAVRQQHACPNVRKGLKLLWALVHAVNAQSDGWAYWRAPAKASEKLQSLLLAAGNPCRGTSGSISEQQFRQALTPIRAMVTRQRRVQARYGNTFHFDVDAALAEPVGG